MPKIHAMNNPNPDTSEYAALLEFITTGGRYQGSLKHSQDPGAVVRHALAGRAKAMAQSVVAVARAAVEQRKH